MRRFAGIGFLICVVLLALPKFARASDGDVEFFEKKIRPVLVEHCYKCHSADSKPLGGGLRLDLKAGWQAGGESGQAAIVPGKPDESPLIWAVRHGARASAMPPNQQRLPNAVVADLETWIRSGAVDPRSGTLTARPATADWESLYQQRLTWWSLQPVQAATPPKVQQADWVRTPIDAFILARLEAQQLRPAPAADRRTLARRWSFALTGLPPSVERVERLVADPSPLAEEQYVQELIDSPQFGEHWARHWMDVVHYSDTHGYEWDVPTKNGWRYRDYLVRAFNGDVSFQRLILEQIAGDLVEPRIDPASGINEALIGPMALRLGERRHGDSAQIEGVTQEAIANIIDTLGKGFLGTTLACAQCHDHKLDPIAQRDYYALAGIFMSTRWGARCLDTVDPNLAVIEELRGLKRELRGELSRVWGESRAALIERLKNLPADDKAGMKFPDSLVTFWQRQKVAPLTREEFQRERDRRANENRTNLTQVADFTRAEGAGGWRWEGFGMNHGLVREGDFAVADEGNEAVFQILPAGRWSHAYSMRLAGALRSPLFPPETVTTVSVEHAAGKYAAQSLIIDQAFHCERMAYLNRPIPGWLTVNAGNFDTLEGSIDKMRRRVYLELVTKSLNNYFPARTGYGGLNDKEVDDPRSWFGVTRVYQHPAGKPPLDELARYAPLFDAEPAAGAEGASNTKDSDWETRFANLVLNAVDRFRRDECRDDDARLLDEALRAKLLTNELGASPPWERIVTAYRAAEKRLQLDRTIGTADDWNEGRDEQLAVRGAYTDLGDNVPRGNARFLGGPSERATSASSGRLEMARRIADPANPLTARVFVNRVWHYLFGEGLVRTPDDFGHLGQPPTHPELLDDLTARFVRDGWSLKRLVRKLVLSATWRQSSQVDARANELDPENRLWHHVPMRRLEAESIRDAILVVTGRLDPTPGGPPIDPFRTATDASKRLFPGPLDGLGRRSLYLKMTLMEPPRFLALFNQPIPKLTVGRRDVTSVPDQALALLNDPFVQAMSRLWGDRVMRDGAVSVEERASRMFATALGRPPRADEAARLVGFARQCAELRGSRADDVLACSAAWQDVAHALFNLKEFIHVP